LLLAAAPLIQSGCKPRHGEGGLVEEIDRSLGRAARFFVMKQSLDGAWRSEHYGGLKDGPTLTPPILKCLFFMPNPSSETRTSFRKGVSFLMSMIGPD